MTFVTLGTDTTLGAARAARADHVVVVDSDGTPVALVTELPDGDPATLLGDVDWPPVVTVPAKVSLEEFAREAVTLLEVWDELPGLVIVDEGRVVDVVPIQVVDRLLAQLRPEPTEMGPIGATGDATLGGDPAVPAARVRCAATDCGFVNTLTFYNRRRPPLCTNPDRASHPLVLPC